jgi:hypothetical protein
LYLNDFIFHAFSSMLIRIPSLPHNSVTWQLHGIAR